MVVRMKVAMEWMSAHSVTRGGEWGGREGDEGGEDATVTRVSMSSDLSERGWKGEESSEGGGEESGREERGFPWLVS